MASKLHVSRCTQVRGEDNLYCYHVTANNKCSDVRVLESMFACFGHLSSRLFKLEEFACLANFFQCLWSATAGVYMWKLLPRPINCTVCLPQKNLHLDSFITHIFDQNSRLHLSNILFVQLYKKKLIHHRLDAQIKPKCFVKVPHRSKATYSEHQAWEHMERMRNA